MRAEQPLGTRRRPSDIPDVDWGHGKIIDNRHPVKDPGLSKMVAMAASLYREVARPAHRGNAGGLEITGQQK